MKLATFTHKGMTRIGVVSGEGVVDLSSVAPKLPKDMISFLAAGEGAMDIARKAVSTPEIVPFADLILEAPVVKPPKVMAIGLNYADHVQESGQDMPPYQIWFSKSPTSITGPYSSVIKPVVSDLVDYEAELCIVIGKQARHVPLDRAHEVIAGYCCGNDISVRDWQLRTPQYVIGKSFDTHGPIGPWITTVDEVIDPHILDIRCFVNGVERQNSNTRHLIFNCFAQIEELSKVMTLEPGDIIFTGTPAGVGGSMDPMSFLKAGDTVRVEIDKLGHIENTFVDEVPETHIG